MKIPAAILALVCTLATVNAANLHDSRSLSARHAQLAHREPNQPPLARKALGRRCTRRKNSTTTTTTTSNENKAVVIKGTTTTAAHTTTTKTTSVAAANAQATSINNGASGVIRVASNCGAIGATEKTTTTSGPNGSIDWMNCGITSGGWNPPYIRPSDIIAQDLEAAIKVPGSPFEACADYVWMFKEHGNRNGIPPIMLASFAMQESSCNPNTVGGAGEQGLMQLTKDKCGNAPGGNCKDPYYNIQTGADYFASTLKANNNNLLISLGQYNGWFQGMTYSKATAAAKTGCCRCQNNLDYLHQFLNGWCQNIDAYNQNFRLGKYFNLDICG